MHPRQRFISVAGNLVECADLHSELPTVGKNRSNGDLEKNDVVHGGCKKALRRLEVARRLNLVAAARETDPLFMAGVRMLRRDTNRNKVLFRPRVHDWARASFGNTAKETFVPMLAPSTKPLDLRSSGAKALAGHD